MVNDNLLNLAANDKAGTQRIARIISEFSLLGDIITLSGELGVGKTQFARFFIKALGEINEVPSPTFTLVQTYNLIPNSVHHFDLFRLENPEDTIELGMDELFSNGISLIEWPERMGPHMPHNRLGLIFSYMKNQNEENNRRLIAMEGFGDWKARMGKLSGKLRVV